GIARRQVFGLPISGDSATVVLCFEPGVAQIEINGGRTVARLNQLFIGRRRLGELAFIEKGVGPVKRGMRLLRPQREGAQAEPRKNHHPWFHSFNCCNSPSTASKRGMSAANSWLVLSGA